MTRENSIGGAPQLIPSKSKCPYLTGKFPFDKKIIAVSAGVSHALFKTMMELFMVLAKITIRSWDLSYKAWDPNIPVKINIGKVRSVKTFVAGRDFSAILTNNDKLYLWGNNVFPKHRTRIFCLWRLHFYSRKK